MLVTAVEEFCNIAAQSCRFPGNPSGKVFANAASKLGVEPRVVERAVDALVFLARETSRRRLDLDHPDPRSKLFASVLKNAGLVNRDEGSAASVVAEFCLREAPSIRGAICSDVDEVRKPKSVVAAQNMFDVSPRFYSLQWRIQVPVSFLFFSVPPSLVKFQPQLLNNSTYRQVV